MSVTIGWIGSICLAFSGMPQAIQCWKQGHAHGLSTLTMLLWFTGEVCYVIATLTQFGWVYWMLTNYLMNLACISVMLRYRFWPTNTAG